MLLAVQPRASISVLSRRAWVWHGKNAEALSFIAGVESFVALAVGPLLDAES